LSGTLGLGNISGVALAITLGGPGAIFWMWIVGFLGMSIKLIEVTLSMLYRDTKDPENPHGGPMWVAEKAFKKSFPEMAYAGKILGVVFSVSVIASAITGGNMFQAWSVADITYEYFGLQGWITGALLSLIVGTVIIGGIKRIGAITATVVPLMVCLYLFAGSYILFIHFDEIPNLFRLIITSAFNETQATGAFIGGTAISAFMFGMKRAVFSNEAGQGSSAIAHSAVKTNEPVREGLVAGLEPLIDTLVVCTFTALIILSTGIWNRAPDIMFEEIPNINEQSDHWSFTNTKYIGNSGKVGDPVIMLVEASENNQTGQNIHKIAGIITKKSK
jgi:AGCS family alanine or glycine:cation symporter